MNLYKYFFYNISIVLIVAASWFIYMHQAGKIIIKQKGKAFLQKEISKKSYTGTITVYDKNYTPHTYNEVYNGDQDEDVYKLVCNKWIKHFSNIWNTSQPLTVENIYLGNSVCIVSLHESIFQYANSTLQEYAIIDGLTKTIQSYNNSFDKVYIFKQQSPDITTYIFNNPAHRQTKIAEQNINNMQEPLPNITFMSRLTNKDPGNIIINTFEQTLIQKIFSNLQEDIDGNYLFNYTQSHKSFSYPEHCTYIISINLSPSENINIYTWPEEKYTKDHFIKKNNLIKTYYECSSFHSKKSHFFAQQIINNINSANTVPIAKHYTAEHKLLYGIPGPAVVIEIGISHPNKLNSLKKTLKKAFNQGVFQ